MKHPIIFSRESAYDRQLLFALSLFLLFLYFLSAKGYQQSGDNHAAIATAEAVIDHGTIAIDTTKVRGGWVLNSHGDAYAAIGIGISMFMVPIVYLSRIVGSLIDVPAPVIRGALISLPNIFFLLLAAVYFFRISRLFEYSSRLSLGMALLFSTCTMAWRYSVWDLSDGTQMSLLVMAVYYVLLGHFTKTDRPLFLGSLAYALLVLTKPADVIFGPLLCLFLLFRSGSLSTGVRRSFIFGSMILVTSLFLFWLNNARWGSPLDFGYSSHGNPFSTHAMLTRAAILIYTPYKGLFIYCPVLLLGLLGLPSFFKRFPAETILFLLIFVANITLVSTFKYFHGDWSWGPRYLMCSIPWLLIPAGTIVGTPSIWKYPIRLIIALSLCIQILSVFQIQHEYHWMKFSKVPAEFKRQMPADIIGVPIVAYNKLFKKGNSYPLSDFVETDSKFRFETGHSLNYVGVHAWWYIYPRLYPKIPWYLLAIIALIGLTGSSILLVRTITQSHRQTARQ